jgi:hypothetical protein
MHRAYGLLLRAQLRRHLGRKRFFIARCRQQVEDQVNPFVLAVVVRLVDLLVVEPPQLALAHPHGFIASLEP